MKTLLSLSLLFLLSLFFSISADPIVYDLRFNKPRTNRYLRSGSFQGYFTPKEFWDWFKDLNLNEKNRRMLSHRVTIGHSYQHRKIEGFYLTNDVRKLEDYKTTKNIIFFTGLHHSREPLSVTMIMLMVIEMLKDFQSPGHSFMKEVLRDNIIFFLPMVNIDSYLYITKMYAADMATEDILMIRKNRNVSPMCTVTSGGVDLNRNYDYKFGLDEEGSSQKPCQEDYRGEAPFSEPETAAIRDYVNRHKNIVSCVNIHTYGNAWIYPFNFVHDGEDHYLKMKKPLFGDFYDEFKADMQAKGHKAFYGNAAFVLDYAANGEAGDWLTGAKNILNIDVELGDLDKRSDKFYAPRQIISKIVRYNWIVMKEFLKRHVIEFGIKKVLINKAEPVITFEIFNKSISNLTDMVAILTPKFRDNEKVKYKMEYGIKALLTDPITPTHVVGNQIPLTFRGRHILELSVFFESFLDLNRIIAIDMIVKRNEAHYLGYPDQKVLFKLGKYLKKAKKSKKTKK